MSGRPMAVIKIIANNFATPAASNQKMKSVCNGVAVIGYRKCNECNGFVTDTVKTGLNIYLYSIISVCSILQSDHKGRLQNTTVVKVFF